MKQSLEDRFWSKVDITEDDECWEWLACRVRGGYGTFRLHGKMWRAHRVAWILYHNKDIPAGMCICHTCDNPSCVNPVHLFLGTAGDNMRDRAAKGRG